MLTALQMIAAFAMLTGVALLYLNIFKMNIGEGFVLSTATLVAVLYITGYRYQSLSLGRNIFCGLAAVGLAVAIVQIIRKKFDWSKMDSAYLPMLILLLFLSILFCYGDFIRYIDELHMWAAAPKYMLRTNRLPIYEDFVWVGANNIGTCVFHYFFQSLTGYNEGMMYASGMLLSWIGLLLPISNLNIKNHRMISLLYVCILLFFMPTLYVHGFKSIYVDVPTATFVGGLAGWIFYRERKWQNGLLIAGILWVAYSFKDYVGLTLDVFFLLLLLIRILDEDGKIHVNKQRLTVYLLGFTVFILVGSIFVILFLEKQDLYMILPEQWKAKLGLTPYNYATVRDTVNSLCNKILGSPLGVSAAKLKISYVAAFAVCVTMLFLYGYISKEYYISFYLITYAVLTSICYMMLVLVKYVFFMSDVYAIRSWASHRYLAIYVVYLFVISLSILLLQVRLNDAQLKSLKITGFVLLLLSVFSIRANSLNYYTSYVKNNSENIYKLEEQKEQASRIQKEIGKEKKVYFLNQTSSRYDEYGMNPAFYYMDKQINHIWTSAWQYTTNGAIIRYAIYGSVKLNDFSAVLSSGGYSYVWIYKTDSYLNENLPQILAMDESLSSLVDEPITKAIDNRENIESGNPCNIMGGQLYEIQYDEQGIAKGLKLVMNLNKYNNRAEYRKAYE